MVTANNANKAKSKAKVYNYGTGRRKTAVARVFMKPGTGKITVNGKEFEQYFERSTWRQICLQPLDILKKSGEFDLLITVAGGGKTGQAGAVRLGVSRALVELDETNNRPALKKEGFLSRDARKVERKKTGKPKARKSPQYSKR